jgi:hypothetical protein
MSRVAAPALQALRPALRKLDGANQAVIPLVNEATPLLRLHVRPFVRAATPYTKSLVPGAERLASSSSDLTAAFHELNRLFNMAAYNPAGTAAVTATSPASYLYWLAWASQTGVSEFSTADANGVFRRTILMLSCDAMRGLAGQQPALESLIGLSGVLSDPTLCTQ